MASLIGFDDAKNLRNEAAAEPERYRRYSGTPVVVALMGIDLIKELVKEVRVNRLFIYLVPLLTAVSAWAFVFLRESPDAGSQYYFYWANGIFVISVILALTIEYRYLRLRQRSIRQISMWLLLFAAAFILMDQTPLYSIYWIFKAVSILVVSLVPFIILMTFFGDQPRLREGRFTPVILVVLSGIWNIHYIVHLY